MNNVTVTNKKITDIKYVFYSKSVYIKFLTLAHGTYNWANAVCSILEGVTCLFCAVNPDESYTGEYTCVAENERGKLSNTTQVEILGKFLCY